MHVLKNIQTCISMVGWGKLTLLAALLSHHPQH